MMIHPGKRHHYTSVAYFKTYSGGNPLYQFHLSTKGFLSHTIEPNNVGSHRPFFDLIGGYPASEQKLYTLRQTYEPRWGNIVLARDTSDAGLQNAMLLLYLYTPNGLVMLKEQALKPISIKQILAFIKQTRPDLSEQHRNMVAMTMRRNIQNAINAKDDDRLKELAVESVEVVRSELFSKLYDLCFVENDSELPYLVCNEPFILDQHSFYLPLLPNLCLQGTRLGYLDGSASQLTDHRERGALVNKLIFDRADKVIYSATNSSGIEQFLRSLS